MTDDDAPRTRLCICCQRRTLGASELQTCVHCVGQTRRDLIEITTLYALLPTMLDGYPRQHSSGVTDAVHRSAETPLMGGDALALLAAGSDARTQLNGRWVDGRQAAGHWHKGRWIEGAWIDEHYELPDHANDEQPNDPDSVLYELEREERDWRHERGIAAATTPATIANVVGYLHDNLTWASQHHPGFDDSAKVIGKLRARLEAATGSGERAERSPAPCFDCGSKRLVKPYGDQGRADHWTCKRCGRRYDDPEYYILLRGYLAQVQLEADKAKAEAEVEAETEAAG